MADDRADGKAGDEQEQPQFRVIDDDKPILHDQAVMGTDARPPQGVEDLDLTNGPEGQKVYDLGGADGE